jgi:hypothetical protein
LVFSGNNRVQFGKALPVQVSHKFAADSAVFDDDHLVSLAGLVPVMALAEQTRLPALLADKVHIAEPRIKSGTEIGHADRGDVRGGRQHRRC